MKKSIEQYISGIVCGEDDPLGLSVQKAKAGQMPIDEVLALIEKLIGMEKVRTASYEKQIGALETRIGGLDTLIGKAQQTEKARVQLGKAHSELANVQNDRTTAEAELNRTKSSRGRRRLQITSFRTMKNWMQREEILQTVNSACKGKISRQRRAERLWQTSRSS